MIQVSDRQQLISSFFELWQELRLDQEPAKTCSALMNAYSEPWRAYHNLTHIQECMVWFKQLRSAAQCPLELAWSLWFHDAIYTLKATDNERQSADWAIRELSENGGKATSCKQVERMIMITLHDAQPETNDECLMVDIDLSILGADRPRFEQYNTQIREEYAWVEQDIYRQRRLAVLQGFLSRTRIYHHPLMFEKLESRARNNLERTISSLNE